MAHVVGRHFKNDFLKCQGEGCDVKWKCWRYSRPGKFEGQPCTLIQGISQCNGTHFVNENPHITYQGLVLADAAAKS